MVSVAAAPLAHAAPAAVQGPAPVAEEALAAAHAGMVKSPMVGTVYLAGEPSGKPFVTAGQKVNAGDTLLIVEAMKVMNPIAAPRARSEEHTSELQSLMRNSYAGFCLK